jgi:anaerobic magnesium-protoporphyrin IX monomethyl ester cyclase
VKFALISTDSDTVGLGIRIISSVLRREGHDTRLIFLSSDALSYSSSVLQETRSLVEQVDAVGISCYSRGSERAQQLATYLRGIGKFVIWGGLHATLNPAECAPYADILCLGEGEETITELAGLLDTGQNWQDIRNIAYTRDGKIVINTLRPPLADLDSLPLFDYDRQDEFHLDGEQINRVSVAAFANLKVQVHFIGSRGCAFHCTYCCNRKIKDLYAGQGKYLRRMSPSRYVEQLEILHNKYFPHASDFFLIDEDFLLRPLAEIQEFARLYKERIGIPFECCGSPPRVSAEKLASLAAAGLWRLRMGIESGSERTKREVYDRPINNQTVLNASRLLKERPEIIPAYFFIIGNPYEERSDLIDTLDLMSSLSYPYFAQAFNLVFFPGSALYDRALSDGTIAGSWDSGRELHTRVGFQYHGHVWKRKNFYLNTLIFLADGKVTRFRLGHLPRFLLPLLMQPAIVEFIEHRPWISAALIRYKMAALFIRTKLGAVLKLFLRDHRAVYDLRRYFRQKLGRAPAAG